MSDTSFTPFTSYMEDRFLMFWERQRIPYQLTRQYQIGPYYADFAHSESGVIIEIDGAAYHSSLEQIARDQDRQRWLESQGWLVIRFPGKQVYRDPVRTVYWAKAAIERNWRQ
jgi:very-short-patch-repair endonuclease